MTFTIKEISNYIQSQDSKGDIMYNLSEENILAANPDKDLREYTEDIDEGELITIEEFQKQVDSGKLTKFDGFTYWVKNNKYCNKPDWETFKEDPLDATHVVKFQG